MSIKKTIIIAFTVSVVNSCCTEQKGILQKEEWKVVEVKNTMLELGVADPVVKDFQKVRKKYINKSFVFSDNNFFFPNTLKNTSSYSDSVQLGVTIRVLRKRDTEQSLRYPGDELNCDSNAVKGGKCFVGDTFMELLGSNANELYVTNAESVSPDNYMYKVCYWGSRQIGLLLENSSILLILQKD